MRRAISAATLLDFGGGSVMQQETQATVSKWSIATFKDNSPQCRARMVLEEAIELCLASGVTRQQVNKFTENCSWRISLQEYKSDVGGEVADVLATLYVYSTVVGIDAHQELDGKMELNRSRPQEYYDDKMKIKEAAGCV